MGFSPNLQIAACKYGPDLCNSAARLNCERRIDCGALIPSQNTMEWTILQSKAWHCRRGCRHSSFIMLIGRINSHLCIPWLPLVHVSARCSVAKTSSWLFNHHARGEMYWSPLLMRSLPKSLILEQLKKTAKGGIGGGGIIRGLM